SPPASHAIHRHPCFLSLHTFGLGTYRLDETEHKGATTTGRASAGVFDRHLIGHALADKRAVKGVEHAGLDVIEGSRVAVEGAPQPTRRPPHPPPTPPSPPHHTIFTP